MDLTRTSAHNISSSDKLPVRKDSVRHAYETRPITPTTVPSVTPGIDPVSPTANLKLLTDMAVLEPGSRNENEPPSTKGRKEKSLALLCTRFLEKYDEYPDPESLVTISLEEASQELKVERRRIYDIVNVFESMEMMCREAKNCYKWYGKTNQKSVLAKLEALARSDGLDKTFEAASLAVAAAAKFASLTIDQRINFELDSSENSRDVDGNTGFTGSPAVPEVRATYSRKEKSLGLMSQKFVMLFLAVKPKIVSLDVAARILVCQTSGEDFNSTAYKTKVRRLYDIANILTSLQLIRKVHVTNSCGRKPAFEYIGPEMDESGPSVSMTMKTTTTSMSSSSMSLINEGRFKGSLVNKTKCSAKVLKAITTNVKTPFTRHSSLQDVCEVAAEERRKLRVTEEPVQKRPSAAILLAQDGRPIQVIAISSPSASTSGPVMLHVISNATSSCAIDTGNSTAANSGGQFVVELPFILQLSNQTASEAGQSECGHILISGNGRSNEPADAIHDLTVTNNDNMESVAAHVEIEGSAAASSPVAHQQLPQDTALRRPLHDMTSAANRTSPMPPSPDGKPQSSVIRYRTASPLSSAVKRPNNSVSRAQYTIVSKKLRM